jgi:hypothetical protein
MNYTLYIQKDCSACREALEYVREFDGNCTVLDIAENRAPIDSSYGILLPALFHNERLVAYGPQDIRMYLQRQQIKKASGI